MLPDSLAREQFCYLTTRGRVTGRPHEIEIWFAAQGATLYLLSGGGARSDWVKNIARDPHVTVRVGGQTWQATAETGASAADDQSARRLVAAKYEGWRDGAPLSAWAREALVVTLHLHAPEGTPPAP